jgi:hypothetical protein
VKVWKADRSKTAPIQVECEVFSWPNQDADGETIYDNSHFTNEDDAWETIIANHKAGVSLACMEVNQLRSELTKAEAKVVKWSMLLNETEENHSKRKRELEASS